MKSHLFVRVWVCLLSVLILSFSLPAQTCANLNGLSVIYTQDFNTLASSGTSSALPAGWLMLETGTNANTLYAAGTGSGNTGDTYSFGATGSTERAFGGLQSGSLVPTIGACFTNNTGHTISQITISYTGEQWRLGTAGRADRLDFQYSTNATSLATLSGTWTDVDALDFSSPVTSGTLGALNGNVSPNRTPLSATISIPSVANGASFFIRWTDFNASGADDGLAVDDFSLTPGTVPLTITTGSLPNAALPLFYSQTLSAAGGEPPYSNWTVITGSLPGGLTLNPSTGVISGTPTAAGGFPFTVQVMDNLNTLTTKDLSITVVVPVCNLTHTIAQIQGNGDTSPVNGITVTTRGIVTATRSNGFFIQMPAPGDGDPATSDGVFVFTSSAPAVTIGNDMCVTGKVQEFTPSSDPLSLSFTEITAPTLTVMLLSQPLPPPVILSTADMSPSGGVRQLEKYQGMRVQVNSLTAVSPTLGNVNEASATATSTGVFFGVIEGTPRPFHEPGIDVRSPLPSGAPCCVPRFDSNPETLRVDSGTTSPLNVTSGVTVSGLVGVLDYASHFYTLRLDPGSAPTASANVTFAAVPDPLISEFTVANANLQHFYDTTNDPGISDTALTPTAFNNRLAKLSLGIRNVLKMPDVIGVEEMENLTTLQAVASRVNNDELTAGHPNPGYTAYLVEGNDIGGIDVGFLVKSRVSVIDVTQVGKDTTYVEPDGTTALLNDRPPLVLRAKIFGFPVTVIVNHLRSFLSIDDPVDGPRVRAKRLAQAEFLANLIQARQAADPTENIVSIGDYNAYEFNDGYADVINLIQGTPVPPDQITLAGPDLVNPDLTELSGMLPPEQRYSYSFDGNAQEIDHFLVNQPFMTRFSRFAVARVNADFPEVYRSDASRPERLSDHDWPVAYFTIPPNAVPVTVPDSFSTLEDTPLTFAAALLKANDSPGPSYESGQTLTVTAVGATSANGGSVSLSVGNITYTPALDFNGADSFTYTVCDNGTTYGLPDPQCSSGTVNVTVTPVNDAPVAAALPASQTVQYSDSIAVVTLAASDVDSPGTALSAAISWKKSSDPSFLTTPPLGGLTFALAGTGANSRQWTLSGRALVAPGDYIVRLVVSDGQLDSPATDVTITVTGENAQATYTGALLASTSCSTCGTSAITLSATVQDISAVAGNTDVEPGDIRNATVTFVDLETNTPISGPIQVTLLDPSNVLTGTATFVWNVDIGSADSKSFTVGVQVGNYYAASDAEATVVTVVKPTAGGTTGGGFLVMENSAGSLAGSAGSKTNFGFNVKLNKNGNNAQGNFTAILRANVSAPAGACPGTGPRLYQIKSTSLDTLAVLDTHARFEGKVNIRDITDPAAPCTVEGNSPLVVTLTDGGAPGADTLGITIWWRGGGLLFSSFWNGAATAERPLGGGNLQVH